MVNVNSDCGGTKNDIRLCYSLPTYGVNKLKFLLDKKRHNCLLRGNPIYWFGFPVLVEL